MADKQITNRRNKSHKCIKKRPKMGLGGEKYKKVTFNLFVGG